MDDGGMNGGEKRGDGSSRLELRPRGGDRPRSLRTGLATGRPKPVTVEVLRRRRSPSTGSWQEGERPNLPQMEGSLSRAEQVRRLEALEQSRRARPKATPATEAMGDVHGHLALGATVPQDPPTARATEHPGNEAIASGAMSGAHRDHEAGDARDSLGTSSQAAALTPQTSQSDGSFSRTAGPPQGRAHLTQSAIPPRAAIGEVVISDLPRGPVEMKPPMPTLRVRPSAIPNKTSGPRSTKPGSATGADVASMDEDVDDRSGTRDGKSAAKRGIKTQEFEERKVRGKGESKRRQTRLTLQNLPDEADYDSGRGRSLAALRRQRERERQQNLKNLSKGSRVVRDVVIPEMIVVSDLANRMAEPTARVVKSLMKMGVISSASQSIDGDTAELVAEEFGHRVKRIAESDVEDVLTLAPDDPKDLAPRAPVVTVMGHVDHGKTSLLDYLRKARVAESEAGGITQHVAAYRVPTRDKNWATFLDTPGHAAFAQIRSRGAKATDIVVLVVAATDGVQDQTIEAIKHAKAASAPIVVAINKIDLPEADPERVATQLAQHEVYLESMGGETLSAPISAKTGKNVDQLLEAIELQAELMNLTANPTRPAEGVLIEVRQERGKGIVATMLIERGTIHQGDAFVAGSESGRVRMLYDDFGKTIKRAGPSEPVEVLGLDGAAVAGDRLTVLENETKAREIASYRGRKARDIYRISQTVGGGSWDELFEQVKEGKRNEVPILIKADTHGSLEAVRQSLEDIKVEGVCARILGGGVGGISESDVQLATTGQGLVVGFNVRANPQARDLARTNQIDMRYYRIIYELIDDIRAILEGARPPEERERILGYAEVRQIFEIGKNRNAAGCMVTEGTVQRGAQVRIIRNDVVTHEGELSMLRRFRDDVKEVRVGTECGMSFQTHHDVKEGDRIECFALEMVKAKPASNAGGKSGTKSGGRRSAATVS